MNNAASTGLGATAMMTGTVNYNNAATLLQGYEPLPLRCQALALHALALCVEVHLWHVSAVYAHRLSSSSGGNTSASTGNASGYGGSRPTSSAAGTIVVSMHACSG